MLRWPERHSLSGNGGRERGPAWVESKANVDRGAPASTPGKRAVQDFRSLGDGQRGLDGGGIEQSQVSGGPCAADPLRASVRAASIGERGRAFRFPTPLHPPRTPSAIAVRSPCACRICSAATDAALNRQQGGASVVRGNPGEATRRRFHPLLLGASGRRPPEESGARGRATPCPYPGVDGCRFHLGIEDVQQAVGQGGSATWASRRRCGSGFGRPA